MAIVRLGVRRFYSSRQAVSEISQLVAGSNGQQSKRSSAASVTSKKPMRGKVAIAARKKMMESFVEKYRATNQGKFPSTSRVQQELGGGYYTVKKMLQEMQYNIKVSSEIAIESSSESQEVLDSQIAMDQKFCPDHGLESVCNLDTTFVTECHDRRGEFHEKLVQNLEDESLLGDNFALKDSELTAEKHCDEMQNITSEIPEQQKDEESKSEQHHHEIQYITSDMPKQQKDNESKAEKQHDDTQNIATAVPEEQKDEEFREKPSLWGNLKMLATGLINMWKK